jgi:uncharacterized phage infection (PIP) family protein YhgE
MTDTRQYDGPSGAPSPGTTEAVKDEATQVASTAVEQGKQTASVATEAAGQTAATAAEGAKQVASEAAQQVTEVTRQATDQARELVGQAQNQLHEQATTQTQRAAEGLADVGRQIRALSDGQPDRAGFAADAARQLADKVEELAGRIEQRGFDGALDDLRTFARRRPGAFLLSAAATGFVVGRLGKGAKTAQGSESSTSTSEAQLPVPATPLLPAEPPAMGTPEPYLPTTTLPQYDGGS